MAKAREPPLRALVRQDEAASSAEELEVEALRYKSNESAPGSIEGIAARDGRVEGVSVPDGMIGAYRSCSAGCVARSWADRARRAEARSGQHGEGELAQSRARTGEGQLGGVDGGGGGDGSGWRKSGVASTTSFARFDHRLGLGGHSIAQALIGYRGPASTPSLCTCLRLWRRRPSSFIAGLYHSFCMELWIQL
jgi:hypothetical protein